MVEFLLDPTRHIIEYNIVGHGNKDLNALIIMYPGSLVERHAAPSAARVGYKLMRDGTLVQPEADFVLESVDTRLDVLSEWGVDQHLKSVPHLYGVFGDRADSRDLRGFAVLFEAFIYHTLLVGHNLENRQSNQKWNALRQNFVDWMVFVPAFDANMISMLSVDVASYYSNEFVLLFDASQRENPIVPARSQNDMGDTVFPEGLLAADVPNYGLAESHGYVRGLLGFPTFRRGAVNA